MLDKQWRVEAIIIEKQTKGEDTELLKYIKNLEDVLCKINDSDLESQVNGLRECQNYVACIAIEAHEMADKRAKSDREECLERIDRLVETFNSDMDDAIKELSKATVDVYIERQV